MTILARLVRIGAIGFAVAVAGMVALMVPVEEWGRWAGQIAGHVAGQIKGMGSLVGSGYQRTPAVVIGLAAALILPVIGFAAAIWRKAGRAARRRRALTSRSQQVAAQPMESRLRPAWILVDNADRQAVQIERELLSIGREPDNDVSITDPTIHRYHALVQRTVEAGYVITDVSGPSGQGIRVNGTRIRRARLASGDRIDIGRVRLTFAREKTSRAVSGV